MSDEEHDYGPPPDTDAIAELLPERYPLKKGERVSVKARTDPLPGLSAVLESVGHRYEIAIDYLRGAGDRDPWMLLSDALDALFGTLIENDRAYRELPQGDDIEYDGAFFRVRVTHEVPALSRKADQLLEEKN